MDGIHFVFLIGESIQYHNALLNMMDFICDELIL
jgi:hypothetical protein